MRKNTTTDTSNLLQKIGSPKIAVKVARIKTLLGEDGQEDLMAVAKKLYPKDYSVQIKAALSHVALKEVVTGNEISDYQKLFISVCAALEDRSLNVESTLFTPSNSKGRGV